MNTTQDAVISIDAARRVDLFNPGAERVFGYTFKEIAGQKVNVLMERFIAIPGRRGASINAAQCPVQLIEKA